VTKTTTDGPEALLADCENFIKRWGVSATRFGHLAVSDERLVARLRNKRDVLLNTAARVRAFITGWEACAEQHKISAPASAGDVEGAE